MSTDFYQRVATVQATLKAPKGQTNNFGGYRYRSCEDILEATKPLLNGLVLTISDDMVAVGDRVYVKATATLTDGEHSLQNTAFARESLSRKGMDDSQVTGSASSYARKYALNGLLLIDDTKDADSMDNHAQGQKGHTDKRPPAAHGPEPQPNYYPDAEFAKHFPDWKRRIEAGKARPDDVVNQLNTSGYWLTDDQLQKVHAIKRKEAA